MSKWQQPLDELAKGYAIELTALRARLAEVEAALRPFVVPEFDQMRLSPKCLVEVRVPHCAPSAHITIGDFRRARAVLDPARKETK